MTDRFSVTRLLWPTAEPCVGTFRGGVVGSQKFVAQPSVDELRHLMHRSASAVVANTRRPSDDRPTSRRFRDAAAGATLLTIGALSSSRRLCAPWEGSLLAHIASDLGIREARANVYCGPPRANQKPVLQLFDRRGRPIAYVKVAWNDLTRRLLDDEIAAIERIGAMPDREFSIPAIIGRGDFFQATWLALAPVSVGRRLRPISASVDELARGIEQTGEHWHGNTASSPYVAAVTSDSADLRRTSVAVARCSERWSSVDMTLGASHGDFVPWNMLSGAPVPAVWDWERYRPAVPIGFDRIHTRFQTSVHRRGLSIGAAAATVDEHLADALPELDPEQRRSHLGWYFVDLLSRYERDAPLGPDRQLERTIAQLDDLIKERLIST